MDKSPDAFRTITEVAEWLDTPAHVLRFWESRFSQIKPVKRAGGRRYYRPTDMLLLGGIKKLLHDDGTTIKAVQNLLRENGVQHVQSLSQPVSVQVTIKKKSAETAVKSDDVSAPSEPASVKVSIKKKEPEVTANADDTPQPAPVVAKEAVEPVAERVSLSADQEPKEPEPQMEASQEESLYKALDEIDIEEPAATAATEMIKLPNTLKSADKMSRQDIQDIEALYYSLKMVRNNMKRTGATR
jgi:DNA-binding transcriptional MerR regulator